MQNITPTFLFNQGCEEPVNFYLSIFTNSQLTSSFAGPDGQMFVANFNLNGVDFLAISGGPDCEFSMASSYMIHCDDQAEVDHYWNKLAEGGTESQCGWLQDKFGVSWQVTPRRMGELMETGTPAQSAAVFQAMMGMTKFIIADLEKAFADATV